MLTADLHRRAVYDVRLEAGGEVQSALEAARAALDLRLAEVALHASAASSLSPVRALVAARVDAATWQDSFSSEAWWEPYRDSFDVQMLAAAGLSFVHPRSVAATRFPIDGLLDRARAEGKAQALLPADGKLFLVAASVVHTGVPSRGAPAVLVLMRALNQGAVQQMAARAGAQLAFVQGAQVLLTGGPRGPATSLVAQADADALLASAVADLGPGLLLVAKLHAPDLSQKVGHATLAAAAPLFGAAALLCAFLFILARRRELTHQAARLDAAQKKLTEAQSALERRSRRHQVPEGANALPALETDGPGASPQRSALSSPSPGRVPVDAADHGLVPFGRYALSRMLGRGGMARVNLALASEPGGHRRCCVIKRLHAELAWQTEAVGQFVDEARLGSSLMHPNVVPVLDFGLVGGDYFMAQEYVLGRDLDTLVTEALKRDGRPLEVPLALFIARRTLEALAYAHLRSGPDGRAFGIVHRDVSPPNIMVSALGEVKLVDFGIAKSEGRVAQTQAGVVKGNVYFMSPEQARGRESDARSDLFSLGLTLFWCLTGESLYTGETDYDRLMKAAAGPSEAEWERIRRLPAPAAALLERALQVNPSARFQSAAEFAVAVPELDPTEGQASLCRWVHAIAGAALRAEQAHLQKVLAEPFDFPAVATGSVNVAAEATRPRFPWPEDPDAPPPPGVAAPRKAEASMSIPPSLNVTLPGARIAPPEAVAGEPQRPPPLQLVPLVNWPARDEDDVDVREAGGRAGSIR